MEKTIKNKFKKRTKQKQTRHATFNSYIETGIMAKFTKQDIQGKKTHIPSFEGY